MSVRVGDRSQGKLQVLRSAQDLIMYTMQICKNERVFPKSQRWMMTQKIVNENIDLVTCIRRANSARADDPDEIQYRRNQQVEAKAHIEALLTLIDIAFNVFDIDPKKIEHWTSLACETSELLHAWAKSDQKKSK